jgi:hypothetical protein
MCALGGFFPSDALLDTVPDRIAEFALQNLRAAKLAAQQARPAESPSNRYDDEFHNIMHGNQLEYGMERAIQV